MASAAPSGSRRTSGRTETEALPDGGDAAARMFWDTSSTLLVVLDHDAVLLAANPAWHRVLGWSAEELRDRPLTTLVHPDDVGLVESTTAARALTESDAQLEVRLRAADHRYVPVSFTGTTHRGRWYLSGLDLSGARAVERGLRGVADFWQQTLDAMEGQVAVIDEHGVVVAVNHSWRQVALAYGRHCDGRGDNYLTVCDEAGDDLYAMRAGEGLRALLAGDQDSFALDYPFGDDWFALHASRFRGEGPTRVVVSHEAITERRRLQEALWTQAALLDELDAAVIALDTEDRVRHWNRGAERLFGRPRTDAVGQVLPDLVERVSADDPAYLPFTNAISADGSRMMLRRQDGREIVAQVRQAPLVGEYGATVGSISVYFDATSQIRAERDVLNARNHLLAVTDSMGEGLYAVDGEGRVTVMNQAAESLLGWTLEEVGGQLMHEIIHPRHPDGRTIPAEDCPLLQVQQHGETLRLRADVFVRRDGTDLPVTYTATPLITDGSPNGCVVVFIDATEVHAEQARLAEELNELAWVQRVQRALDERRFELFAQPIVHLASGRVTQHELLLRVRAPDGVVQGPVDYLRTAEEHGLIGEIDRWVIQESLALAAGGMHVELNISASSVGDEQLLRDIETWLTASGADPSLLVFEITETALIRDEHAGRAFVHRLHELGFKVALDDFGTGYGGFTYLKQLPVHYLKIDIEFVRDLCDNDASRHVVQAVVNLARGFGLRTVAEGVEDERTLELLAALGVDFAQGYHIGRPGPIDLGSGAAERGTPR